MVSHTSGVIPALGLAGQVGLSFTKQNTLRAANSQTYGSRQKMTRQASLCTAASSRQNGNDLLAIALHLFFGDGGVDEEHQTGFSELTRNRKTLFRGKASILETSLQINLTTATARCWHSCIVESMENTITGPTVSEGFGYHISVEFVVSMGKTIRRLWNTNCRDLRQCFSKDTCVRLACKAPIRQAL